MRSKYHRPLFPPACEWDHRLTRKDVCHDLEPVDRLHLNEWFEVRNRGGYFTIEPTESHVVLLPIIAQCAFLMVRVYRPVLGDITLELPAGAFDLDKESPEQGAARELAEETGIVIDDLSRFKPLPPLSVSPNRNPYLAFAFQIEITQQEFQARMDHDDEIESVHQVPFSDAIEYINGGDIYVSVPVALISRYLLPKKVTA